ncbi:putative colanic acid biosynthesis acetyltransferase [Cohnella sp. GCM10027633]|uniref:putative colanic acid biosynthesis acetyltransferase n=1 Tax=unclassified Cohnella TaxID=2636738 RepID=UPI00362CBCEA
MANRIRLDEYDQNGFSRGRNGLFVLLWWFVQGTLFRFSLHPMYGWRRFVLRLFGANIGRKVLIRPSAKFTYPWKVKIGDYSWIGDNVEFYSLDTIIVGAHCVVSQKTYLCTGSHNIRDPRFGLITSPIRIEDGAWVASDVFVHPGVTIGEMAVVAARSTVLKNVAANEVHAGTPAKLIGQRMEAQERARGEVQFVDKIRFERISGE